jgi:hypothetical protein
MTYPLSALGIPKCGERVDPNAVGVVAPSVQKPTITIHEYCALTSFHSSDITPVLQALRMEPLSELQYVPFNEYKPNHLDMTPLVKKTFRIVTGLMLYIVSWDI